MTDTRAERIARIDQAVAHNRQRYIDDYFAGYLFEAEADAAEVDRLLDLRNRVQRGWPKTSTPT